MFYTDPKSFPHCLFEKHEELKEHTNVAKAAAMKGAGQNMSRVNEKEREALCNIFPARSTES